MRNVARLVSQLRRGIRRASRGQGFPRGKKPVDLGTMPVATGFSSSHLFQTSNLKRCVPLLFPPAVSAQSVNVDPEDLVLAVAREGEAKIYPIPILVRSHIVNDTLAGRPLLVTFCAQCFSGIGFDPVVDGRALTFEIFGLYEGAFAMRDSQTGTIWGTMTGGALAGPLVGSRLAIEPVEMATFGRWLELHPNSLIPDPDATGPWIPLRPGEIHQTRVLERSVSRWDHRLGSRTLVLGVDLDGKARAYPMDPDRPGPRLFQDVLGGIPIALLAAPGAWPLAYDRKLGSRVVELRLEGGQVVDAEGSVWLGNRAISGPSAGMTLAFIQSHLTEWFAWSATYPHTEIIRIGDEPGGTRESQRQG